MSTLFEFKSLRTAEFQRDKRLWQDMRRALATQFPNPKRQGCPKPEVLAQLVAGRMPIEQAEPWLDHFSRCSECLRDFERLQSQRKSRHILAWTAGAVAAVVSFCLLLPWLPHLRQKRLHARSTSAPAPFTTTQSQPRELPAMALHLEAIVTFRDTDRDAEATLPHLTRGPVTLSIYLPLDCQSGSYEFKFLRKLSDSAPPVHFQAAARDEQDGLVARIATDLSPLQPGAYLLAFRSPGGKWRYARVTVS